MKPVRMVAMVARAMAAAMDVSQAAPMAAAKAAMVVRLRSAVKRVAMAAANVVSAASAVAAATTGALNLPKATPKACRPLAPITTLQWRLLRSKPAWLSTKQATARQKARTPAHSAPATTLLRLKANHASDAAATVMAVIAANVVLLAKTASPATAANKALKPPQAEISSQIPPRCSRKGLCLLLNQ